MKAAQSSCPKCNKQLKYHGERSRKLQFTPTITLKVNRAYYTCQNPNCRHKQYPLDEMLGLSSGRANGMLLHSISFLAAHMPYRHVCQYLRLFRGAAISETMVRQSAQRTGSKLVQKIETASQSYDAKQEQSCQKLSQTPPSKTPKTLYIQADGAMVPICPDKQKTQKNSQSKTQYCENKLAMLFDEKDIKHKTGNKCEITKKRFVSSLGKGVEHFTKLLRQTAFEIGAQAAQTIVFISDGAVWLDKMRERLFPNSIHILDWYHAVEHLYECARKIFGETAYQKMEVWAQPLQALLYQGKAKEVCDRLLFDACKHKKYQTALRELYGYYHSRLDKMQYDTFRSKGYFIGSGAVESANKYLVQARLKQAGMKWRIEGAEAMIYLRQKIYENNWEEVENCPKINFSHK